jgi:hypothetical protein
MLIPSKKQNTMYIQHQDTTYELILNTYDDRLNLKLKMKNSELYWEKNIYAQDLTILKINHYIRDLNHLETHLMKKLNTGDYKLSTKQSQIAILSFPISIEKINHYHDIILEPRKMTLSYSASDISKFVEEVIQTIKTTAKDDVLLISQLEEIISANTNIDKLLEPFLQLKENLSNSLTEQNEKLLKLNSEVSSLCLNKTDQQQELLDLTYKSCLDSFLDCFNGFSVDLEKRVQSLEERVINYTEETEKAEKINNTESNDLVDRISKLEFEHDRIICELKTDIDRKLQEVNTGYESMTNSESKNFLADFKQNHLTRTLITNLPGENFKLKLPPIDEQGNLTIVEQLCDGEYITSLTLQKVQKESWCWFKFLTCEDKLSATIKKFTLRLDKITDRYIYLGFCDKSMQSDELLHQRKDSLMFYLQDGSVTNSDEKANEKKRLDKIRSVDYITVALEFDYMCLYHNGRLVIKRKIAMSDNLTPCVAVLSKETVITYLT